MRLGAQVHALVLRLMRIGLHAQVSGRHCGCVMVLFRQEGLNERVITTIPIDAGHQ
jgi:hypothetical protein